MRLSVIPRLLLAATVSFLALARAAEPPLPGLVKTADGAWTTSGLPYSARVSPLGYLESLQVNGFDFLAPAPDAVHGLYLADGQKRLPFAEVKAAGDTLSLSHADAMVTVAFRADGLHITLANGGIADGLCGRLELARNVSRIKDPISGTEYASDVTGVAGAVRLIAPNGAALTVPGQNLYPGKERSLLKFPYAGRNLLPTTFRLTVTTAPLIEDSVKVTTRAATPDSVYSPATAAQSFYCDIANAYPDRPFKGDVILKLKPYLKPDCGLELRQSVKLKGAVPTTLAWTLEPDKLEPTVYTAEVWVTRGKARGLCCAPRLVFNAPAIQPPPPPDDFDAFWATTLAEQVKVPLDLRIEKVKEVGKSEVSKFSFAGLQGRRCYGYLTVPLDKTRKVPAVLVLPSSGVHGLTPPNYPEGDTAGMAININWCDVDWPAEAYDWTTWPAPYLVTGILTRESYSLRFGYAAIARAAEILAARPEVKGDSLLLYGSSQGGGLTLVGAGLCGEKFKAAVANVPGLCRIDQYLDMQPPYFPIAFNADSRPHIERTLRYYDATAFASRIRCPILVGVGLMDDVTSALAAISAYNAIPEQFRKGLTVGPASGHVGIVAPNSATDAGLWP